MRLLIAGGRSDRLLPGERSQEPGLRLPLAAQRLPAADLQWAAIRDTILSGDADSRDR